MLTSSPTHEEDEMIPELPREIWREIGRRNRSRLDVLRFRSVCRTWRSSLPPPIRFPLQVPDPIPVPDSPFEKGSFFISEVTFYAATTTATAKKPSTTSIVAFEEEEYGKFSASTLLHNKQFHTTKLSLPPLNQLSTLSFLSNAYHIHIAIPTTRKAKPKKRYELHGSHSVLKIVIITSDNSTPNPNYSRLCDFKIVAHLINRKLAVLSLTGGAMKNNWDSDFPTFEDIINYKGQLYAINIIGETFIMDYNTLQLTKVTPAQPGFEDCFEAYGQRKKLNLISEVEDRDDNLYMFFHNLGSPFPTFYRLMGDQWVEVRAGDYLVIVKDSRCNFAVARNLIRRHTCNSNERLLNVPPVISWPQFKYVRIAVGFNNTYSPHACSRSCDLASYLAFTAWKP